MSSKSFQPILLLSSSILVLSSLSNIAQAQEEEEEMAMRQQVLNVKPRMTRSISDSAKRTATKAKSKTSYSKASKPEYDPRKGLIEPVIYR